MNDPKIAHTLNHMANIYLEQGNAAAAVGSMAQATRIMKHAGGSGEEIRLTGFQKYAFSVLFPENAAVA